MIPTIVIFDCDNVIADDGWRIPMIKRTDNVWNRYHNYHLASAYDNVGNRHLLHGAAHRSIYIFTAMPEHYRHLRELWFNHRRIPYTKLVMRPDNDHRPSVELKRSMLLDLFDRGFSPAHIAAAYDDRPDVVAMYRKYDVNASVVRIHSLSYAQPHKEQ